jgi:SWIB/MDM2 domain
MAEPVYVVRCGCTFNPFLVTKNWAEAQLACEEYQAESSDEHLKGAFVDQFELGVERDDADCFNNVYQPYQDLDDDSVSAVEVKNQRPRCDITTPCSVSTDLLAFLNEPEGTMISRSNVFRAINKYIKDSELMDSAGKFRVDAELSKLLSVEVDDVLSLFSLPKHLRLLFSI